MRTRRWLLVGGSMAALLVGLALTGARTNCVPIEPDEPVCEGENPQGCVNTGCPEGEVCMATSGRCIPSHCFCDADTGGWICTEDCGGGVCVPHDGACEGENPQGCHADGCPAGEECVQAAGVCVPSACACDAATGQWICTADCGGGICLPAPDEPCPGENPAGCAGRGCPEGEVCAPTDACIPSACGCDATTGHWVCTADCGGGACVPETSACEGPNPEGCSQSGCPAGQACMPLTDHCVPSSCTCFALTGAWVCTRDCGGGVCVP